MAESSIEGKLVSTSETMKASSTAPPYVFSSSWKITKNTKKKYMGVIRDKVWKRSENPEHVSAVYKTEEN